MTYKILLLHGQTASIAQNLHHHVLFLEKFSKFEICRYELYYDVPETLNLENFDGVIVHYSLMYRHDLMGPLLRRKIRVFSGIKVIYLQDENRKVIEKVNAMAEFGIDVLFSVMRPEVIAQVYADPRLDTVRKEATLTGYVPPDHRDVVPLPYAQRPIDVGYRARDLSRRFAWIGRAGAEKGWIGQRFAADAGHHGLVCDISSREEDRLYGEDWTRFILSCKAMLGSESGASVCDFTGEIQQAVEAWYDAHPDVTFEELSRRFFAEVDGTILMTAISPRCFEAAAYRTLMVQYDGDYSGILEPWRHYVPLRKDHANMDEVVAVIRSPERAQRIIDAAYQEIACNPAYHGAALADQFDRVFDEEFRQRHKVRSPSAESGANCLAACAADQSRRFPALESADALPVTDGIYIYGASQAGRLVAAALGDRVRLAGFIDSRRRGEFEGLPLLSVGELGEMDGLEDCHVVIASMHRYEIAAILMELGLDHRLGGVMDATPLLRRLLDAAVR